MDHSKQVNPTPADVTAQERARLLRLAYRFCWERSDAEDVLQNALLVAVEKSQQLREPVSRWPWLCRVVIQQCYLRGRKRQRRNESQGAADFSLRDSSSPTHAANLDKAELGELMRRLLLDLPERQRAALTLRHLEQMEYGQIARIMAISESTVRAHVHAGREALRNMISARHAEWQL